MPKINKIKLSSLPNKSNRTKTKTQNFSLENNDSKVKKSRRITKFTFFATILSGTAIALTFILLFTLYATAVFLNRLQNITITATPAKNVLQNKVIYQNDKITYRINDTINLNIINNTAESIFLAPCQYFNKFEKKALNKWNALSLADCSNVNILPSSSIEKISKKAEEQLLANRLGEGVWRGVSTIYFGCKEARVESCAKSQIIYTKEFTISSKTLSLLDSAE